MSEQLVPVRMYQAGYTDLISVVPVNATLSPGSKITADQIGKVPGRKLSNGTWAGYGWRTHQASEDEVRQWTLDGANIGLRAGKFPGLDIDCLSEEWADLLQRLALFYLGPAPVRVGKWPKRLLMYTTRAPMTRMRLYIDEKVGEEKKQHLVEVLGEGQQYLVYGTHPATKKPYTWGMPVQNHAAPMLPLDEPPAADQLTPLTLAKLDNFFDAVAREFGQRGMTVHRDGDGRRKDRTPTDQAALKAPSDEELRTLIDLIPNTDELFPGREEYIRLAYAIRAACHETEEGYSIFASWAIRHVKSERVRGNPETWRGDWRRIKGPFSIGWDYLCAIGRDHGYASAPDDFPTEGSAPLSPLLSQRQTVRLSEQWLAREIVTRIGDRLRFVPATGRWLVWDGHVWKHDEVKRAAIEVREVLHEIATEIMTRAGSPPAKATVSMCQRIESARTLSDVMRLMQADRSIATPAASLDADPWILNTPAGIVDLKTGQLSASDPAKLCTRITRTGPDLEGAMPLWKRFLAEATGGDCELEDFLQRYAGYCLTGLTVEQIVMFMWGGGGNGKGTFVNAVRNVMGDYGAVAAPGIFLASGFDKHTTDLADLMGARIVTTSEIEEGVRWNEQRLKMLSGSDPIKARFMRQDNITYQPQFKLIFFANHKPQIRNVDAALRRRIRMVPFIVTPAQRNLQLEHELVAEYPAILGWLIEGCRLWQARSMQIAPPVVEHATAEYFEDEDAVGRWMQECCDRVEGAQTETITLYESWREWGGSVGEYIGSMKRFSQALAARHLRRQLNGARRSEFVGIQLKPLDQLVNDIPPVRV